MRVYADVVTATVRAMLTRLAEQCPPDEYRALMISLGEQLAAVVGKKLSHDDRIMLICTNEDADFLAKGVLRGLGQTGPSRSLWHAFGTRDNRFMDWT